MGSNQDRQADSLLDMALGNEQFLKYAKDLVTAHRSEKQKRMKLESANEKIRAIIDSISEGVVATDEGFKVIEANQSLCRLLEMRKEEIFHRSLLDFLDIPGGQAKFTGLVHTAGESGRFDIEMKSPKRRVLSVSVAMLSQGQGYVMVFVDITAAKRIEKMKEEFFSILTHELNTPLSGIVGLTSILSEELKGKINEEQFGYIQDIITCGNRMTSTVKELVNFAKLQDKALGEMDHSVDVWGVIQEAIQRASGIRKEKNISIDTIDRPPVTKVTGNAMMLKELFSQVLDNAILFGNDRGVVSIALENSNKGCEITISDDGIGIPASELERVFDSFYQVEEHYTRSQDGLGLGLSLAKRIAELHGGCIDLESILGKGTKCRVTLPYQRSS